MNTDDTFNSLFLPRDRDGHILPMIFSGGTDGNGNPAYYPFVPPLKTGKVCPMFFPNDFKPGGQFYGSIRYSPGFYPYPLGLAANGDVAPLFPGNVIFTDPRLNMCQLASELRQHALPPELIPAANHVAAVLANCGCIPSLPDNTVLSSGSTSLYLPDSKNRMLPICNTEITVSLLRRIIGSKKDTFEVNLLLSKTGETVTVPVEKLDNLVAFLSAKHPWLHLYSDTPNAAPMLSAHIRDQLDSVPECAVVHKTGWIEHNGHHHYAHDGAVSTSDLLFECGQAIPVDPLFSPVEAFQNALGILDIGLHRVTVPLLLTTIAGVLTAVFQDAGYPPRFCTFLHGHSGSLKTAVAEVFANFFGTRDHSTFRDTPAALDVNISKHRDRMFLVDDFHPPASTAEGRVMNSTLEHIVRLFGDDVCKQRSNSTATATHGERPRGTCIITGEFTSGSYSSLLRCLLVPVTRGEIDGTLLRRFQDNPTLWTSIYAHFLPWVGAHWTQLVAQITQSFPELRTEYSNVISEPRLVDTGAVLELTGKILLDYGISCGGISSDSFHCFMTEWQALIKDLLTSSSNSSQEMDIANLCHAAILNARESGLLRISATIEGFGPGLDGFYTPGRFWLRQDSLFRILREHANEMQVSSPLTPKHVLPELYAKGTILRDEENGRNSFLKKTPVIPATGKRIRMLCFTSSELSPQV